MLGLVAVAAALTDWWAVWQDRIDVEQRAKPATIAALIGFVLLRGGDVVVALLIAIALGFSVVGDLFLLPRLDRFIEGLAAFFAAHVVYLVAFLVVGADFERTVLAYAAVMGFAVLVGRYIVAAATLEDERLGLAVVAYIMVLTAVVAVAVGTNVLLIGVGAALFAASDGFLGWHRFVRTLPQGRLITHMLYHLGQALFAVGALTLSS